MVAVVPVLLLVFGAASVIKPDWIAVLHRHQKAAGTTHSPADITVTNTWLVVTRVAGVLVFVVGVVLTVQSL